jgi:hypothetical protein
VLARVARINKHYLHRLLPFNFRPFPGEKQPLSAQLAGQNRGVLIPTDMAQSATTKDENRALPPGLVGPASLPVIWVGDASGLMTGTESPAGCRRYQETGHRPGAESPVEAEIFIETRAKGCEARGPRIGGPASLPVTAAYTRGPPPARSCWRITGRMPAQNHRQDARPESPAGCRPRITGRMPALLITPLRKYREIKTGTLDKTKFASKL